MENEQKKVMEETKVPFLPRKEVEDIFIENLTEESQTISQLSKSPRNYSPLTQFKSNKIDFTWKIDRFISLYNFIIVLTSPAFPETAQYKIEMIVNRTPNDIKSTIDFYLLTETGFLGSFIVSIILGTGTVLSTKSGAGFIKNKRLLGEIEDVKLHGHDRLQPLVISCKFETFDKTVSSTDMNWLSLSSTNSEKSILDDDSISDNKNSIKFKIRDEYYIVPKNLLCATNSNYFKYLCKTYKSEEKDMTNKFVKSEPEAFKEMLLFIKTGSLPEKIDCTYQDILTIADRYDVQDLKLLCEQHLLKQINIENALSLMQLAISCRAKRLKSHVANFIKFHMKEIVYTKEHQLSQAYLDEILESIGKIEISDKTELFFHHLT